MTTPNIPALAAEREAAEIGRRLIEQGRAIRRQALQRIHGKLRDRRRARRAVLRELGYRDLGGEGGGA